jgi:hypothetical protein
MACADSHINYLQQGRNRVRSSIAPKQPRYDSHAETVNTQRRHIA